MLTDRAATLRAQSEHLLGGEPPPELVPTHPQGRVLAHDEHLLTAEDWATLDSEPPHRLEMTRRSILDGRRQEAARRRQPSAEPALDAERIAQGVLVRGLKPGGVVDALLRQLMRHLGAHAAETDAGNAARFADLERRLADLEARDGRG